MDHKSSCLYIKLDIMKQQFVWSLDEKIAFVLSEVKLKEGVFDRLQIEILTKDIYLVSK